MGLPQDDGFKRLDPTTVPDIMKQIEDTEGKRPAVNDARAVGPIKKELTEKEVIEQNQATLIWEKSLNDSTTAKS